MTHDMRFHFLQFLNYHYIIHVKRQKYLYVWESQHEGVQQRRGAINLSITHKAVANFMIQCFDLAKIAPVHTRQEAGWASQPILIQWYKEESQLMSIYPVCNKPHPLAEQSYFTHTQPIQTMLFVSLFTILFGTAKSRNSHSAIICTTLLCYVFIKRWSLKCLEFTCKDYFPRGNHIKWTWRNRTVYGFTNTHVSWSDNSKWLKLYETITSVYSESTS